jgi:formylglycine-generating enzyme required for sulfatase activity
MAIAAQVINGPFPDPLLLAPDLSRGLVEVIRRATAADPAARYQVPPDLVADLDRLLADPGLARTPARAGAVRSATTAPGRRSWLLRLALFAVLVVAVDLAFHLASAPPAAKPAAPPSTVQTSDPPTAVPVTATAPSSQVVVELRPATVAADAPPDAATQTGALMRPPWAAKTGTDAIGPWADLAVGGVVQRLRLIPAGTFTMGSPANEYDHADDETQHQVTIAKPFWMADTLCTQALWHAVMGTDPSHFHGADLPVEQVSWYDAKAFCAELTARGSGLVARLPSESEWEYACRAGNPGIFSQDHCWSRDNAGDSTHAVRTRAHNAWGLYDPVGNTWEWCADGYGPYPSVPATDPAGVPDASLVVTRGGGYNDLGATCRPARRRGSAPGKGPDQGFRFAIDAATP